MGQALERPSVSGLKRANMLISRLGSLLKVKGLEMHDKQGDKPDSNYRDQVKRVRLVFDSVPLSRSE